MNIRMLGFISVAVMLPLAMCQGKPVSKAVIKSVQSDYDRMSKAFAKNDLSVFEGIIAEDYVLTPTQGKDWDRTRALADFKRQMSRMKNAKWTRHIKKAHMDGDLIVVEVAGTFHGSFLPLEDSFPGEKKKMQVFDLKSSAIDSWDISGKAHKLKKSKILKLDAKVDGKKMG